MVWKGPRSPKHIAIVVVLRSYLSPLFLPLGRGECGDSTCQLRSHVLFPSLWTLTLWQVRTMAGICLLCGASRISVGFFKKSWMSLWLRYSRTARAAYDSETVYSPLPSTPFWPERIFEGEGGVSISKPPASSKNFIPSPSFRRPPPLEGCFQR